MPPLIIQSRACLDFSHAISMNHTHFLFLFDLQHANSFDPLVITCTIQPTIHKYWQTKPKVRLASSFSSLCFFCFFKSLNSSERKRCESKFYFYSDFSDKSVRCLDSVRIHCPVSVCPDPVCLDSVRCQDSVRIFRKKAFRCLSVRTLSVSILSGVRILSGFLGKTLSVVCLSGRTRTRQSCPDFRCPCPPTSGTRSDFERK